MKPTYDELSSLVQLLTKQAFEYQQTIKKLEKRITELEEKLNLNSKNSSKPPSSDQKVHKKSPKGGGKPGHKGQTRQLVSKCLVSKTIISPLSICDSCRSNNLRKKPSWIFQQIDLPEIKPFITQIECERAYCRDCKKNSIASVPSEYEPHSFGPKLSTFIGLLTSAYRMSKRCVKSLLKTVFGIDLSLGVIPSIESRLSEALAHHDQELFRNVQTSDVAYVDETGFRQQSKNCFVWTISTKAVSVLRVLPSRSLVSSELIRPRDNKKITVTDRYSVYKFQKHQYCLAHLIRDFKKFAEKKKPDGSLAKRLLFELKDIFVFVNLYRNQKIDLTKMRVNIGYRRRRFRNILEEIYSEGSERFGKLAKKLLIRFDNLFLFTRYPETEPTNNIAERTLRHIVMWRKTSYGTQSSAGSVFLERTLSVWMTLKKQGRDAFEFFLQAYQSRVNQALSPTI